MSGWWMGGCGWEGVKNEMNANSAFNLVGVKVEVEADLGQNY